MEHLSSTAIRMAEASYDLEVDDSKWLPRLLDVGLPAMDVGLGVSGAVYVRPPDSDTVVVQQLHVASGRPDFPARTARARAEVDQRAPRMVRGMLRPGVVTTLSEAAKPWVFDVWRRHFDYAEDVLTLTAVDPDGQGIVLNALLPEITSLSPGARELWQMVGAHMSAGHRIRRGLAAEPGVACAARRLPLDADAVIDPRRYEVAAAVAGARAPSALGSLRRAAVRVDRARSKLGKSSPQVALEIWWGLVRGRWSLVDWFDSDGRRFLLALPNPPEVGDPRGLSAQESQVATFAALGESHKLIGYRFGLSQSRVSKLMRSVMRKLGVKTQAQLVERMRGLPPRRNR